ncbi:MAG TPA: DUF2520 domain-containing protein [Thermoanaerobaculia bacterium]|jgi:predicted short-subunit dehydrogenase-like oxidoreductase (DUF2520 family)|nr:DUF2520 domain-containing protein [Thermoanaerobaculia bacterium]
MNAPLSDLTFSLVGPGRVGRSLAAWAEAQGARCLAAVGRDGSPALSTAGQDLLLIAVPDGVLAQVAAELAARPQAAVALHTSGSLDAEVLAPLRGVAGMGMTAVGSLHPLKAFPQPLPDLAQAHGVFFALDGDPPARALAHRLAAAWGAEAAEVPAAARTLYHFAATLAAGGVVTLLALAEEIAVRLRLPAAVVRGYLELSRGAVAAAIEADAAGQPVAAALTGPAARGDRATVERQLAALADLAPRKVRLVTELARETLWQKKKTGELTAEQLELLEVLEEAVRPTRGDAPG